MMDSLIFPPHILSELMDEIIIDPDTLEFEVIAAINDVTSYVKRNAIYMGLYKNPKERSDNAIGYIHYNHGKEIRSYNNINYPLNDTVILYKLPK